MVLMQLTLVPHLKSFWMNWKLPLQCFPLPNKNSIILIFTKKSKETNKSTYWNNFLKYPALLTSLVIAFQEETSHLKFNVILLVSLLFLKYGRIMMVKLQWKKSPIPLEVVLMNTTMTGSVNMGTLIKLWTKV